jgi:hypothetical protein
MGDYLIDAIIYFKILETFNISSQRYEGIFLALFTYWTSKWSRSLIINKRSMLGSNGIF